MKIILLVLLLTASGLLAQTPEPTSREEALRRALRNAVAGKTNAPAGPAQAFPASPAPAVPAAPPVPVNPPPPVAPALPATSQAVPNASGPAVPTPPNGAAPAGLPPNAVPAATAPAAPALSTIPVPSLQHNIPNAEEMIPTGMINWTAADLNQVLTIYAEMVGRTILRPAGLASAPIVLKAQTPLTRAEAVQALDAVLALNNIAMVNVGEKFVKAVPVTQANQEGAPFSGVTGAQLPNLGSYVTHVVQLKYSKPSELVAALQPFAKIPNSILPIDTSGILVLRDITENVKRMLEMIEKIDVTVQSEFISEVIPIKYAKAEDIASALNSVSSGGGGTTVGARSSTGTTGGAARPGTVGYNPNQPGQPNTPGSPTAGSPSSGASFTDRLRNIIQKASTSSSGDLQILGTTKIIADARSNSLLIFATRLDMTMIKDIVSKLDVVLAQVLIETVIMDVTIGDDWSFGVSAVQKPKDFNSTFAGAGGMNANKFFDFAGSSNTNALGDLLGSGIKYFGKVNEDILISVEAAASEGRLKVVQRPRIQTSHATPASLFIGSTVPYVTSTYYGGGFGGGPSSSYQQLEVGIRLNVTPFINQEGLVVMQIEETIAELNGSTKIEGVGDVPNTKNSTLSAEVAVRDGEAVILGGIVRNSDDSNKSGVPYLKDIPLLGYLFRSTSSKKARQESIVLMRPTVLRTPELAAQQVALERKKMPGISEAAASMRRDQLKSEIKESERLKNDYEADQALELKYKALEQKLLNMPDPLPQ